MTKPSQITPIILRRRQVEARVGLSRSTLYALIAEGLFPEPIHLSAQAVGWLEHEVDSWLEERIRATRAANKEVHGDWRPCEYHTTIETAVNSLARRLVRTSEVPTLADALAAVENTARTLTLALAPHFKVERQP
jgi:prophage regulatory protein